MIDRATIYNSCETGPQPTENRRLLCLQQSHLSNPKRKTHTIGPLSAQLRNELHGEDGRPQEKGRSCKRPSRPGAPGSVVLGATLRRAPPRKGKGPEDPEKLAPFYPLHGGWKPILARVRTCTAPSILDRFAKFLDEKTDSCLLYRFANLRVAACKLLQQHALAAGARGLKPGFKSSL